MNHYRFPFCCCMYDDGFKVVILYAKNVVEGHESPESSNVNHCSDLSGIGSARMIKP